MIHYGQEHAKMFEHSNTRTPEYVSRYFTLFLWETWSEGSISSVEEGSTVANVIVC